MIWKFFGIFIYNPIITINTNETKKKTNLRNDDENQIR
jgi:hypothetical protein